MQPKSQGQQRRLVAEHEQRRHHEGQLDFVSVRKESLNTRAKILSFTYLLIQSTGEHSADPSSSASPRKSHRILPFVSVSY